MKWTDAEIDIVAHASSRGEAYKRIRSAGFKRTQGAVWRRYRQQKEIV